MKYIKRDKIEKYSRICVGRNHDFLVLILIFYFIFCLLQSNKETRALFIPFHFSKNTLDWNDSKLELMNFHVYDSIYVYLQFIPKNNNKTKERKVYNKIYY